MTHPTITDETATPTRIGGVAPRLAAVICYLPFSPFNLIMACICAFGEPRENRFLRLHGFQILFAAVAQLLFVFIGGTLNGAVALSTMDLSTHDPDTLQLPTAFLVLAGIESVLFLVFFTLLIIGLIQAARGRFFRIPVIGGLAERFA